jgi:hypothetical protein
MMIDPVKRRKNISRIDMENLIVGDAGATPEQRSFFEWLMNTAG